MDFLGQFAFIMDIYFQNVQIMKIHYVNHDYKKDHVYFIMIGTEKTLGNAPVDKNNIKSLISSASNRKIYYK